MSTGITLLPSKVTKMNELIVKILAFSVLFPIIVLTSISLFLYLSLLFSGYLLIKRNKFGAVLSYFQCPFRLLTFIPISLFFLTWPVKYVIGVPSKIENPFQAIMQAPVIAFLSLMTIFICYI